MAVRKKVMFTVVGWARITLVEFGVQHMDALPRIAYVNDLALDNSFRVISDIKAPKIIALDCYINSILM